jgi:hypothetical protein
MHKHSNDRVNKYLGINLLSISQITSKWIPRFLSSQYSWKILSGKWKAKSSDRIIYLKQPNVKTGENISIIGSKNWADFNFQVRFKILTQSINPPEGGVILYYLFKNLDNFYSFHFCLSKHKIQLIKKLRGTWSRIAEQTYDFETQKDYSVIITTMLGMHQCKINGTNVIQKRDTDISKGCIGLGIKYCDVEFRHASVSLS